MLVENRQFEPTPPLSGASCGGIGAGTVWAVTHADFWPCGPPMYLAHTEFFNLFKGTFRQSVKQDKIELSNL